MPLKSTLDVNLTIKKFKYLTDIESLKINKWKK